MATKSLSDEMHDALVELYGPGSIADLLRRYCIDFPSAGKWLTPGWLPFIKSKGATGVSYSDTDLDFWKRRLDVGNAFTPATSLSSGLLKAWYEAPNASAQTLVSDDFNRVPEAPVTIVSDTFTRVPVVTDDFSEVDGTNLNGKATDTGQVWVATGTLTINSGKILAGTGADAYVETGLTDVAVNATIQDRQFGGLQFRYVDNTNRWLTTKNEGTSSHFLKKVVAGSTTDVISLSYANANPSVEKVIVIGNTIQVYVDNILKLSATDGFNATATKHGIYTQNGSPQKWDDFSVTRADLGTAETGHAWTERGVDWGINSSGQAVAIAAGVTRHGGAITIDNLPSDIDLSATIIAGSGDRGGLIFRWVDSSNYWAYEYVDVTSQVQLVKVIAGAVTGFGAVGGAAATPVLRVTAIGSLITTYQDNVQRHTISDSALSTATSHGLFSTIISYKYDNFLAKRPAIGVSDDFSEVDGTSLNGKLTDTGQVWVLTGGTATVQSAKANLNAGAKATVETGLADVALSVDVTAPNSDHGPLARYTDASNYYAIRVTNFATTLLNKVVAGVTTTLVGGGTNLGGTFEWRLIGSLLTVRQNGVSTLSTTDSTYLTPTKHGIYSVDNNASFDNFSVTRADLGYATGLNGTKIPWVEQAGGDWGIDATGKAYSLDTAGVNHMAAVNVKAADVDVAVSFTAGASFTGYGSGIGFRFIDTNNYNLLVIESTPRLALYKVVAGVATAIGTYNGLSLTASTTYNLRVTAIGSALACYVDTILRTSATDAANNTGTQHGLRNWQTSGVERFDNFSVKTPILAAGDSVSVLPDLSGNNNHASQATAANQPKYGFGTITDDFSEADATALSGKSLDTGQVWATGGNGGPTWRVTGTKAYVAVANFDLTVAYVETGMPDVNISADVTHGDFASGLSARVTDFNNYLGFFLESGTYQIKKRVAGAITILTSGGSSLASPTLLFVCKGSVLTGYENGVQKLTATDSAHSTITKHGLYNHVSTAGPGNARFDNFSVTSLAAGKPVISFDGADDKLVAQSSFPNNVTAFAVYQVRGAGTDKVIFQTSNAANGNKYMIINATTNRNWQARINADRIDSAYTYGTVELMCGISNGTDNRLFIDGASKVITNATTAPVAVTAGGVLGSGDNGGVSNEGMNGDLVAVLMFEGVLNYSDRKKVEAYLQAKYGTPALAA